MRVKANCRLGRPELLPLVRFVANTCKYANKAEISIIDAPAAKLVSGGYALRKPSGSLQVTFYLSREISYPCLNRHQEVPELGWVRFNSWEEEFVFVLAHELRHVDQFATITLDLDGQILDPREREIDAERHARRVLNRFREAVEAGKALARAA